MSYLPDSPDPASRVLVAYLPHPADWQRILHEHWYRIPVRSAPQRLAVEYLAFYLPAAFGAERWSIRHYAPLLGWRVLPRHVLLPSEAAHPRADELYYRLALGAVQALPVPVPARRLRRISFIETSFVQLVQAQDVNELWQAGTAADSSAVWGAGLAGRALR